MRLKDIREESEPTFNTFRILLLLKSRIFSDFFIFLRFTYCVRFRTVV